MKLPKLEPNKSILKPELEIYPSVLKKSFSIKKKKKTSNNTIS
jgi:hypothetical protein